MKETIFSTMATRLDNPVFLDGLGSRAVSLIQKNIVKGPWAPNAPLTRAIKGSGAKPLQDFGHLIGSITHRVEGRTVVCGTNRPAASILHDGGTIVPKKAKYLTIPAGNKTRSLMRMYGLTPRSCIEGMKGAGYSVWFSFGPGGGNVFAKKGKKGELFLLFILKKSITVPARPFVRLPPESRQALAQYLARYMAVGTL